MITYCLQQCVYIHIYNIYIYTLHIYTHIFIYIYVCVKIQMMLLIYPSMSTAGKFLTVSRSCTSSQKVSKVMLSCSEAWLIFFGYGDMWTMWIQYIIVHVDIHIYTYIYIYIYIYLYYMNTLYDCELFFYVWYHMVTKKRCGNVVSCTAGLFGLPQALRQGVQLLLHLFSQNPKVHPLSREWMGMGEWDDCY